MRLRAGIRKALRAAGWELRRIEDQSWHVGSAADHVATLIDIGAARGTPEFSSLNAAAKLFQVDPLEEYQVWWQRTLERRAGGYEIAALGNEIGTIELTVDLDSLTKSSILEHTKLTRRDRRTTRRIVPLTTLDELVSRRGLDPPFGIKIDTEGFELEVVKGASETLSKTHFVVAETSVQKRFEGSYTFEGFVAEMCNRGFLVANVLNARPDRSGLVRFMDILYTREPIA